MKECQKAIKTGGVGGLQEVCYFQYQRMMRYGGRWHLEKRAVLPGCIFLCGEENAVFWWRVRAKRENEGEISVVSCEAPYLKCLCQEGSLVEMSKGIIENGALDITGGPLRGKEQMVKKIDRHKRTAEIEIPFDGRSQRIMLGLEIYAKQG